MLTVGLATAPTTSAAPTVTVTTSGTSVPTTPPVKSTSSTNTGPYIVWAAALALVGVVVSQVVQGWLARRANRLTQASIDATRDIAERTAERAEADAKRAELDALAKQYQDAAEQLGHEKAAVRLAGVYAMARLADNWPEQRQACVDVLCAYMRMPWPPAENDVPEPAENQVRLAIASCIRGRLQQGQGARSWSSLRLDFSWAVLNDLDLTGCIFLTEPTFKYSHFRGVSTFRHAEFAKGADFVGCRVIVASQLLIQIVKAISSTLHFDWIQIERDAHLRIEPVDVGLNGRIQFDNAHVEGTLSVRVTPQESQAGLLQFRYLTIATGGDFQLYPSLMAKGALSMAGSPHIVILECVQQPGAEVLFDQGLANSGVIYPDNGGLNPVYWAAELRGDDPRANPDEVV